MTSNLWNVLGGLAVLACGCAHTGKPEDQLASSEASVRTAQELGAREIPPAALELQLATDELARAKEFIKDDDNEKAQYQLWRSKADAELALALTHTSRATAEADAAEARLSAVSPPAQQ